MKLIKRLGFSAMVNIELWCIGITFALDLQFIVLYFLCFRLQVSWWNRDEE